MLLPKILMCEKTKVILLGMSPSNRRISEPPSLTEQIAKCKSTIFALLINTHKPLVKLVIGLSLLRSRAASRITLLCTWLCKGYKVGVDPLATMYHPDLITGVTVGAN